MLDALTLPNSLRASVWPARLVLAVALVFCVWKAVTLLWLVVAGPDLPPVEPVATVSGVDASAARGQIAKWHLFGDVQGVVDLAALAQQRMQETPLKLTLRGTFNEVDPEGGIAIIADEKGTDSSYRVGDVLPGDARLERILAGVVVLSRDGVSETLSLRLTVDSATTNASMHPVAPRSGGSAPLPGSMNTGLAPIKFTPAIAPGMPDMQTYRATNLPDVQELAKQVQIFPVFANGRMRGVRLSAGRDSDVLAKAGLKPNDVVTSVNGIALDSPARQGELLSSLRDASQVQVDVERDGKTIKLQLGL